MTLVSPLVTSFTDESKKAVFSCHSMDSHHEKERGGGTKAEEQRDHNL